MKIRYRSQTEVSIPLLYEWVRCSNPCHNQAGLSPTSLWAMLPWNVITAGNQTRFGHKNVVDGACKNCKNACIFHSQNSNLGVSRHSISQERSEIKICLRLITLLNSERWNKSSKSIKKSILGLKACRWQGLSNIQPKTDKSVGNLCLEKEKLTRDINLILIWYRVFWGRGEDRSPFIVKHPLWNLGFVYKISHSISYSSRCQIGGF